MTKGKWPGLELCLRAGPKWGVSPSTSLQHSPAPCSAEGEHPVFLITSHMCEVKGNERGMRHKSHHHSTFTRQVGLSYNSHQCLTKWLTELWHVLFDCIRVYWCESWWLSVTEAWGQSMQWDSPASVPSLKHDHCTGAEMVSTSFLLVSGMTSFSTNQNVFRNLVEMLEDVLAVCVGHWFIPFCRLFCAYLHVLA